MTAEIDPAAFVATVRPFLERHDLGGLAEALNDRWAIDQLTALLGGPDADARKVAAVALSLVGDRAAVDGVAAQLADPDPVVNHVAEHAIWAIWFRLGSKAANAEVWRGAQAVNDRAYDRALAHFDAAIAASPDFAEAYNQRAIAHYLQDRYAESIADCRRAVRLMPCHFGALAGMGHCFLHEGQLPEALRAYGRALAINPHWEPIRQAADEIRQQLAAAAA